MAQYTEIPNESYGAEININLWNQLAGQDGNLQYLYEVALGLIENYYAIGYRTYSSFTTSFTQIYSISTQEKIELSSNNEKQFYNDISPANIKIQKSGVYLLYLHFFANNNAINTPTMTIKGFYSINNEEEFSTLTNHSVNNATVALLSRTSNPVHFIMLTTLENNDVVIPKLQQYTSGLSAKINTQSGNNLSDDNYFAKSPYITTVYLGDVSTSSYPDLIFLYSAKVGILFSENNNPYSLYDDEWYTTTPNNPLKNYDIVYPNTNTPNRWKLQDKYSNPNISPIFDDFYNVYPKSILRSLESYNYNFGYIMIGFESLNKNLNDLLGYEQNLFSLHQTDAENNIIGTPFTISISSELISGITKVYLWVRIATIIRKIELQNFDLQNQLFIGLVYNRQTSASTFRRCLLYINSSQIVFDQIVPIDYAGYLSSASIFSIGGEYFYSASLSNQRSFNSSIFFVGNWNLSNYRNSTIRNSEISSLWNLISNTYNIDFDFYDKIITTISGDFIVPGTFQFGEEKYFA